MDRKTVKTAFILGAGLGTRLRPLTDNCPKPLLNIAGRPIIAYTMDHLITIGIERFIVNTHYLADAYKAVFPGSQWRGIPITFRYEPVLLDTGGGLKNIEDLLEEDETIIVYNGDIISDLPLAQLIAGHREKQEEATLALRSAGSPLNVSVNDRGDICDMRHILGDAGVKSCLFTGIYVVERRFLSRLESGVIKSVVPAFVDMIRGKAGSVADVIIDEGNWNDIGSVEEFARVNKAMSDQE